MATITPAIIAVFFLGMGGYALAAPQTMLLPFGIRADNPNARSEIRAVYGGFGLAIAAILIVAATHTGELRTGILLTVAAALTGMAVGRIIAAVLGDRTAFYPNWFYCLVEAAAAAALFVAAAA
ncbi:DUF4345 domain-containing protein [Nocardia sp. NPDC051030]|uniref:DUF4345 domain-containing protein n=1 Tax=Nocardia sp. NPDC051030 TaxID=3155162 RepID=UPI00341327A8